MKKQLLIYLLVLGYVLFLVFAAPGTTLNVYETYSFSERNLVALPPPLPPPLMVDLTLIEGAASKGAVCLDGSVPGYHLHRGHGSGASSWLIHLEGGAWCNSIRTCVLRTTTPLGSSKYMEKKLPFIGMLSDRPKENPVFYNWNRVKIRYCDGASFMGDSQNEDAELYFRGQQIFSAVMEELMSKGMQNATQTLLSGCSAGGLAAILHCDKFRKLFSSSTRVKCLSDAGFFLDAVDVSGRHTLRKFFRRMIRLQKLQKTLPRSCTSHLDPTSCFFPQNLVEDVKTPLFILNAAYDTWQIQEIDPRTSWVDCKLNHSRCTASQMQIIQELRNQMLSALKNFSMLDSSGLFINPCFAHCQCERGDTWFTDISVRIGDKRIAESIRDWYFYGARVKAVDCRDFCDKTCPILVPL